MAPAVRNPRIESAIVMGRARNGGLLASRNSQYSRVAETVLAFATARGERNFGVQRREAKIGRRDRKRHRRPKERNDTGENPQRNGLSGVGAGICRFVGLDGGDYLDQTACSPRRDRTGLRHSSQERNFLLQRQDGKMGSFAAIAGAETALTKQIDRHVFEIAELLRVSLRLHNLRVWVVGTTGIEPVTPTMSR
jgi:hypothetical protein